MIKSSKNLRTALFASTFLGSVAVAATVPASAAIDEMLVTAQKREQSMQDVPLSVSHNILGVIVVNT